MEKRVTSENIDDLHPDVRSIVDGVTDKMLAKDVYFFDILTIAAISNVIISVIRPVSYTHLTLPTIYSV